MNRFQSITDAVSRPSIEQTCTHENCFHLHLELILTITETWGDQHYCGLTGIEVVDINNVECLIQSFDARPRDVTVLPNHSHDVRTLDK